MRTALAACGTAVLIAAFSVTAAAAPASSGHGLKKVHDPGRVTGTLHGHCAYRDHGQLPDRLRGEKISASHSPVLPAAAGTCPEGAVMADTWPYVEAVSLASVSEFTVTEDHLKLLRHAYLYWEYGEGYGAPAIDPKRPYGNSDV